MDVKGTGLVMGDGYVPGDACVNVIRYVLGIVVSIVGKQVNANLFQ